jgi:spermidine synthase
LKPWDVIGHERTPDGTELTLMRHTSEYVIKADGQILMSSRMHGSEEALATLGCADARTLTRPRVLIGGLGMGFTLRAALDCLPPDAIVRVTELIPSVVEWNRGPLAALAQQPLDDPRVRVEVDDVIHTMRANISSFDAILLDVDNGPSALTASANAGLYGEAGIAVARRSLKPGGVLAVWSAKDDDRFERRLRSAGFSVERNRVSNRQGKRGSQHTILVARVLEARQK